MGGLAGELQDFDYICIYVIVSLGLLKLKSHVSIDDLWVTLLYCISVHTCIKKTINHAGLDCVSGTQRKHKETIFHCHCHLKKSPTFP